MSEDSKTPITTALYRKLTAKSNEYVRKDGKRDYECAFHEVVRAMTKMEREQSARQQGEPVAWLIERADGSKEVVLSPLTDDTCMVEGDEAIPLYAAPPAPPAYQWRPIESAPKDGNTVLVGRHMGETWGFVYGAGYWASIKGINGWICRGLREPPGELGLGAPTHWQPLPAAPRSEKS